MQAVLPEGGVINANSESENSLLSSTIRFVPPLMSKGELTLPQNLKLPHEHITINFIPCNISAF